MFYFLIIQDSADISNKLILMKLKTISSIYKYIDIKHNNILLITKAF